MDRDLETVTGWLLNAAARVPREYFHLPVAGQEGPAYRERVYTYELYHQWRCQWQRDFPYSVGAEVDKAGHPVIRRGDKPDFIVHVPGENQNLLVVEVKPANASRRKIMKDLRTLTRFRRSLAPEQNYFAAYFWIYGVSQDEWVGLASQLRELARDDHEIALNAIVPVVHEAAALPAVRVAWNTAA